MKVRQVFVAGLTALASTAAFAAIAAPADAAIVHTARYNNITNRTFYVYTGNGCTGTRRALEDDLWSGYNLSYKASYNTKARTVRNSGHIDPWSNNNANVCYTIPQYTDYIRTVTVAAR